MGLDKSKGQLAVGFDGDVCVFDDEADWVVGQGGEGMLWRNKVSAYAGKKMKGCVKETWVRGRKVYERGRGFVETKPGGKLLLEKRV